MAAQNNPPVPAFVYGFARLPGGNRVGLLIGVAALVAALWAAFMWSSTPDYRLLFSNISDRDGGAIVQALTQMNVPYKFSEGGGVIMVPANQVHDARLRLASQGLPRGGTVGFELMENQKFGATQFQEQVNYQRGLEGELARSIQSLAAVQAARVHLAIPKASVFLRDNQKPSASVLVSLHPGRTLERAQVAGIVHLVSSSVPELALKNVSVVDQTGALLSGGSDGRPGAQLDANQLAHAQQIEGSYVRRIQDILEPIVGRANVRAQVTADIDFSESEATAEIFKPNQNPQAATIRSQQTRETNASSSSGAGGVPGALTNQPAPAATAPITGGAPRANAAAPQGESNSSKDSTINYEVDKTVRHTRTPVGSVRRISAAVVVNHRLAEAAEAGAAGKADAKAAKAKAAAKPKPQPLSAEEMSQITALVKEAIGYSQNRGDTLNVVNIAFAGEAPIEPLPELPMWKQPENIAMAKELGKGIGIAALLLLVVFGILRPLLRQLAAAPPPAPQQLEGETLASGPALTAYQGSLQSARQIAKQDPKVVAGVVRGWVSGNE
jgi:flagellar M-ring protein FliF